VSYTTASHLSHYTSLVEVAAAALGGGGKGADKVTQEDLSEAPPEMFQARVASLLSR
jgi:hypothetical protein